MLSRIAAVVAAACVSLIPTVVLAQAGPLPALPTDQSAPPPAPPPVQPAQQQPPPQYGPDPNYPPPSYPPPSYGYAQSPAPPPVVYTEPPVETHAPKFSLWTGARLGIIGFGNSFFDNEQGQPETTGNFVRNGLAAEIDVGARLGKRYTPYVFLEHGFMGKGHRFEGTTATASSDLYGIGFRYTAGDVDSAGFLSELSVGVRTITVSNGSETYKMSGLEIFRLGLGAEIRISTLFVISPMAQLSGGTMTDTKGSITYAPNQGDALTHPTFQNDQQIIAQRGYLILGLGCGAHFDFFGK